MMWMLMRHNVHWSSLEVLLEDSTNDFDRLQAEVREIRGELYSLRRRYRNHLSVAVVLIVAFGLLPSSGGFARGKKKLVVESAETGQALEITPDGLHFTNAGASRFRMQFGEDWPPLQGAG